MSENICPKCGEEYDYEETLPREEYVKTTWFGHCKEENDDGTVTVYHNK